MKQSVDLVCQDTESMHSRLDTPPPSTAQAATVSELQRSPPCDIEN